MFKQNMLGVAVAGLFMAAEAQASAGASDARVKFCDKDYDPDSGICVFKFGNGTTLELSTDDLKPEIQRQLMLHGALQKIGDSYAGAKGNFAEGISNAQDVINALKSGEWGTGRDEGKPRLGELSAAIAKVKGISLEDATAAVEAAPEEKRKEWRAHPKIKAAIALGRAEKAQREAEAAAGSSDDVKL